MLVVWWMCSRRKLAWRTEVQNLAVHFLVNFARKQHEQQEPQQTDLIKWPQHNRSSTDIGFAFLLVFSLNFLFCKPTNKLKKEKWITTATLTWLPPYKRKSKQNLNLPLYLLNKSGMRLYKEPERSSLNGLVYVLRLRMAGEVCYRIVTRSNWSMYWSSLLRDVALIPNCLNWFFNSSSPNN